MLFLQHTVKLFTTGIYGTFLAFTSCQFLSLPQTFPLTHITFSLPSFHTISHSSFWAYEGRIKRKECAGFMNECAYHCSSPFLGSAHHLHLLCWVRNILSPSPETRSLPKIERSLLPTLGFWWRCCLLWNFLSATAATHGLFFSISDQEPTTAPHTHITLLSNVFLQPFSFTVFSSPHFLIISPFL